MSAMPLIRQESGVEQYLKEIQSVALLTALQEQQLARRMKKSRSQLYGDAVREYLAHHAAEDATEAVNRLVAELNPPRDEFVALAARRILEGTEW